MTRALVLGVLLAACGSSPPPEWPARPFRAAEPVITGEGASSDYARQLHRELHDRLERELGEYVVRGGVAVEGRVSSPEGSWRVAGTFGSSERWAGLDLRVVSDRSHWFVARWDEGATCSVTTSVPYASNGTCERAALTPRTAFDVEVGLAPDAVPLHVEIAPAESVCPGWLFDRLRGELSGRSGFSDESGRWSWALEGDAQEGRFASREGDRCCWERASWQARPWIEPRCPGRYGVDLTTGPVEIECAPCAEPPRGCAPPR